MDEKFNNVLEHFEHTVRIIKAHLTSPCFSFADAANSDKWLKPIVGSLEHSIIRENENWKDNMSKGLEYWKKKDGRGIPVILPRKIRIIFLLISMFLFKIKAISRNFI
jgi:hypothetical protein